MGMKMSKNEQVKWYLALTCCGVVVILASALLRGAFNPIMSWIVHAIGWLMVAGGVIPWCDMNKHKGDK